MDHSFIWETLRAAGIPTELVAAIQKLYHNNCHKIRVGSQLYDGPVVRSGVRQGCPLSGLLFSICVDVLLLRLQDVLTKPDEIARAFADDTVTVVSDYAVSIPTLALLFHEFGQISRLRSLSHYGHWQVNEGSGTSLLKCARRGKKSRSTPAAST